MKNESRNDSVKAGKAMKKIAGYRKVLQNAFRNFKKNLIPRNFYPHDREARLWQYYLLLAEFFHSNKCHMPYTAVINVIQSLHSYQF